MLLLLITEAPEAPSDMSRAASKIQRQWRQRQAPTTEYMTITIIIIIIIIIINIISL